MRLVRQVYASDCGIAVAAMVSHRRYIVVRETAREAGLLCTSGTSIVRMVAILERCTGRRWEATIPDEFRPLVEEVELVRLRRPMVLLIKDPDLDRRHWIAAENGHIYCPGEEQRCRLAEYEQRSWVLRRILTPAR